MAGNGVSRLASVGFLVVAFFAALAATGSVSAAAIPCAVADLRAAIDAANADADETLIELPAGCTFSITDLNDTLPNGLPLITTPVILQGNGAIIERSPAAGTPEFRLFQVAATGILTIEEVWLRNGLARGEAAGEVDGTGGDGLGGAIYNDGGQLSINFSTVSGNLAIGGAGDGSGDGGDGLGGGVYSRGGPHTFYNSTFSGNTAAGGPGGPGGRAGEGNGGAILAHNGSLVVRNVTAVLNSSGVRAMVDSGFLSMEIWNSVLTDDAAPFSYIAFPPFEGLHEHLSGVFLGTDATLGPLALNGGSTPSHMPLPGSPVIDGAFFGANFSIYPCEPIDQRGVARPLDGDGDGRATCDAGAVEAETPSGPRHLLFSVANGTLTIPGLGAVRDEDIILWDGSEYSMFWDGSEHGLNANVDAFSFGPDGSLLFSLAGNTSVPGVGIVAAADVLRWSEEEGWQLWFDSSDVGLSMAGENIDAIEYTSQVVIDLDTSLPAAEPVIDLLLFSTSGAVSWSAGPPALDEDVLWCQPNVVAGETVCDSGATGFDGKKNGLGAASEDVSGVSKNNSFPFGVDYYLSMAGNWSVSGLSGTNEDVLICADPGIVEGCKAFSMYFDGSANGLPATATLDAIHVPAE